MDHLQIAQGLKDAVAHWCFPVTSGPAAAAAGKPSAAPSCDEGGGGLAGNLDFLHQLLNLKGLIAAVPEHQVPLSLLHEEAQGVHDWRTHAGAVWDTFTPLSSSGASTFRSITPTGPPFTARSGEGGAHQRAAAEDPCSASQGPLKESAHTVTQEAPSSLPAPSPPHSELFLSVEVEEDVHADAAGEGAPRTPPALPSAAKLQARRRAAATAAPSAAAAAAPASAAHPRQQQQQPQQQQQQQQVVGRQARTSTASALAAKSGKRRPEPGVVGGAQPAVARGGMHTDVAAATSEGVPVGGPAVRGKGAPVGVPGMRAEGPPQKRQAVARQRGEAAQAVTRSNSSTTSSSSSGSCPLSGKAAAAAARGALASRRSIATASRASSSGDPQGRQRSSSIQSSARPKHQPSKQQQQQREGLAASEADDLSLRAQRPEAPDPGGDEAAANAAAAAAAAIRSSSSRSADGPVSAFAAQWLLGCEKRLRASGGPPSDGGGASSSAAAAAGAAGAAAAETLMLTKKRLKQELRDYNAAFACRFGRQPLKDDKEPLRPLYMHYQQLKQQIEGQLFTSQGEKERGLISNAAVSPLAAAPAVAAAVGGGVARSSSLSVSRQMGESERAAGSLRISRSQGSRETLASPGCSSSSRSSSRSGRRRHAGGCPSEGVKQQQRDRSSSSSSSSSNWQHLSAYEWQQQMQQRRAAMTEQLHALQRERRLLGDKLAAFHVQFREKHGRQLRLKADIVPVQREYDWYVQLTQQIEHLAFELQQQTL
ncbi:hypothetical protein Esti_001845 [Eimeria stiedai]